MATIATLFVKLGLDTSAYSAGLAKAANSASGFANKLGASSIAAGKALSLGLTAPILAAGIGSIKAAADFEMTTIAFTTMLGSAEDAQKLLGELAEFGVKTPFTLPEVEKGAKGLLAYGIEAKKILPTMKSLGDVSAGLNVPIERMILNFGQVKAQGKLTGRELRDFAILGVPLIAELAKILGVAESEITELVSKGKIGFPLVEKAFTNMSGAGGKFQDLMQEMNKTTAGQFAEMKDEVIILARAIGKDLLPIANDVIAWVKDLVAQFTALNPEQRKQVMMWAGIVAAVGPALIIFGLVINVIGGIIAAVGFLTSTVGLVLVPVLLLLMATAALVALAWKNNFMGIQEEFATWAGIVAGIFAAFKLGFEGDWTGMGTALRAIWDTIWLDFTTAFDTWKGTTFEDFVAWKDDMIGVFEEEGWVGVGKNIMIWIGQGILSLWDWLFGLFEGMVIAIQGLFAGLGTGSFPLPSGMPDKPVPPVVDQGPSRFGIKGGEGVMTEQERRNQSPRNQMGETNNYYGPVTYEWEADMDKTKFLELMEP